MELWKDIPNWEGWYQVSNLGRVRSVDRISIAGGVPAKYTGKVLAANPTKAGYPLVSLVRPGKREYRTVHALVMRTFVGEPPKGQEVCHNNGVRTDCRLDNLRYDTRRNNSLDRRVHGTASHDNYEKGEERGNAKLTEESVRYIRNNPSESLKTLSQRFGVSISCVHLARKRKSWAHV